MVEWSTACPDWADRLREGRGIIPAPIFPSEAERALEVFKSLRIPDLPGKPTFGEACDPWVFDFVAAIFGAYDADTGQQLIREFYLLISKKNTKSTIAAGIMLTALILCWREEEELLILAPTIEVAGNSFKPAAGMVRADDELQTLFNVQDTLRTITHRVNRNTLKVVAADTQTVSGKKSGKVLVEEHWIFGKRADADAMFLEALGGQISRDEGFVIYLTTQSDEPPAGVFAEKLGYFRDVRDGKVHDPRSLPVLYEFPEDMVRAEAYLQPENFHIANPNLGRSVSVAWLEDQLRKHKGKPTFQKLLAKHLNVQIGMLKRVDAWAGAEFWERQGSMRVRLEVLLERCDVIDVGIDGGGLDDMLGLTLAGRERAGGDWLTWSRAWLHPIALQRRQDNETVYRDFEKAGDLVIVERVGQDIEQLVEIVRQVNDAGLLDKIGVDPAGIGAIVDALEAIGIDKERIVGISQGWRLNGAIKTTERKLAEGALHHGAQPLMTWCVSNAKTEPKGNAVTITKQVSGTGKIDPLMALFNAVTLLSLAPAAAGRSWWDRDDAAAEPAEAAA